jgi:hypothetical protein
MEQVNDTGIVMFTTAIAAGLILVMIITWLYYHGIIGRRVDASYPILDISGYDIVIIEDETMCEDFFQRIMDDKRLIQFIGFDCEWVNGGNVALIQLAFINKQCALVRLSKIGKITDSLAKLLTDKNCYLFGVGSLRDGKKIGDGYGVWSNGCIDLRNIAIRCGVRSNMSLAGLTKQFAGCDLNKSLDVICSDWEMNELSHQQVNYSSSDAIAALIILKMIVTTKYEKKLIHNLTHTDNEEDSLHDYNILQTDEGSMLVSSLCQGIIDVDFKSLSNKRSELMKHKSLKETSSAYSIRQSPLYHNCQLLAPDGTLLSTVDRKKIDWYLKKDLGELICDDPPTLKLNFEPSGKPNKDREYYLSNKMNICVACGRNDTYIRKYIIPHEYRKHFPSKMKEHLSHDVVLLCVRCHQISSQYDSLLRQDLAREYSIPLDAVTQKYHEDYDKIKIRNLARALSHKSLPEARRDEIMESISDYLNCHASEVTPEMIEDLANIETK